MNLDVPFALVGYIEPWWMVIIKSIVFALIGLQLVPVVLIMERKILGRFQNRYGPNRVGLYGIGTPIADIIKLLSKEPFRPKTAIGWLFELAPILSITAHGAPASFLYLMGNGQLTSTFGPFVGDISTTWGFTHNILRDPVRGPLYRAMAKNFCLATYGLKLIVT